MVALTVVVSPPAWPTRLTLVAAALLRRCAVANSSVASLARATLSPWGSALPRPHHRSPTARSDPTVVIRLAAMVVEVIRPAVMVVPTGAPVPTLLAWSPPHTQATRFQAPPTPAPLPRNSRRPLASATRAARSPIRVRRAVQSTALPPELAPPPPAAPPRRTVLQSSTRASSTTRRLPVASAHRPVRLVPSLPHSRTPRRATVSAGSAPRDRHLRHPRPGMGGACRAGP